MRTCDLRDTNATLQDNLRHDDHTHTVSTCVRRTPSHTTQHTNPPPTPPPTYTLTKNMTRDCIYDLPPFVWVYRSAVASSSTNNAPALLFFLSISHTHTHTHTDTHTHTHTHALTHTRTHTLTHMQHAHRQSCAWQMTLPHTRVFNFILYGMSLTHYSSVMTANPPPPSLLSASVSSEGTPTPATTPTPTHRVIICCDRVLLSPWVRSVRQRWVVRW